MKIKIILVLMILLFVGCAEKDNESEQAIKPYEVGDIITLKGVEGGEKTLKRISHGFVLQNDESKVLVIDIFGTFCPPCKEEAPNLTNYQIENSDKVAIIGLTHLENVTDEYVVENFTVPFNGHYFISNSKENERIVATILEDIKYPVAIQLPFKVVLKDGVYQEVTDVWENKEGIKFYLGKVGTETIKKDIENILK